MPFSAFSFFIFGLPVAHVSIPLCLPYRNKNDFRKSTVTENGTGWRRIEG